MTKSELKQMIREMLREELAAGKTIDNKLEEATDSNSENGKAYITYFRYDSGEDYYIYGLTTSKNEAITEYKESYLPKFLSSWPDDVSTLVLQEIDVSKATYNTLLEYVDFTGYSEERDNILDDLYDRTTITANRAEVLFLDGLDTNYEICDFFVKSGNYEVEDYLDLGSIDNDDLQDEVADLFMDDEDLYNQVMADYIKTHY